MSTRPDVIHGSAVRVADNRLIRNTYTLLAMTLLFSAAMHSICPGWASW